MSDQQNPVVNGTDPGAVTPQVSTPPVASDVAADWRAGLPEDLKNDPSLATFKDVGTLAKSYVHTKKMVNEKGLIPPKADAPQEMWDQFYNALGRPESPDKYEFGELKLPEGYTVDTELEKGFREQAHSLGLTPKQAQALREWYFGDATNRLQNIEVENRTTLESAEKDLREEWGVEFDHKVQSAQRAWQMFADPAELPALTELFDQGLGNNPLLVRLFSRVAAAMGEDRQVSQTVTNSSTYHEQARDLMQSEAYTNASHPQHKDVVAKAEKLFRLAFPEEK